jgi:hypothetical protein
MGLPKSPRLKVPQLCGTITSCANLRSGWGLNQSCSPHQELSDDISHATCTQGNWVDSRLPVVGSQTANLTPGLSFGHNLCYKCPNGSCEPILDIYASITFQWYKEFFNVRGFDLCKHFSEVTWEFIWECECSFSHSPTLPGSFLGPHFCKPLPWSRGQG